MKKLIINIILITFAGWGCFAAAPWGKQPLDSVWRWAGGDNPAWSGPGFDDASWTTVSLPGRIRPSGTGQIFWLRTRWEVPAGAPERLWFLTNTQNIAFDLFVNGRYAGSRGTIAQEYLNTNYRVQSNYADAFLLPPVRQGEDLTIALRVAYRGSAIPVPMYYIGDAAARDFQLKVVNSLNGGLYVVAGAISLLAAGLCFVSFRKEERHNQILGVSLGLISFYMLVNGSPIPVLYWLRGLSRWAITAAIILWPPFFSASLKVFRRRFLLPLCAGLAALLLILLLLASSDDAMLWSLFTTVGAGVMFLSITGSAMIVWEYYRSGDPWGLLPLGSLGFALICVGYDAASYAGEQSGRGTAPVFYLQSVGLLVFLISIVYFLYMKMLRSRDAVLEALHTPVPAAAGPHAAPALAAAAAETALQDEVLAALIIDKNLSPKEVRVIHELLQNKSDKEIATALNLSSRTIQTYLRAIYLKTGVPGRKALVDMMRRV